jgi:hypothetical protein
LVGLFNKKKEKMSWQIPTQIEQDIIAGKATYRTFQTGNGGQSILPVPANSYAVIFGYDFSPAGGGFKFLSQDAAVISSGARAVLNTGIIRFFETQQISFYTGTDFYPFIHHVDVKSTALISQIQNSDPPTSNSVIYNQCYEEIDSTPIARQVYITSPRDVTITHGLILNSTRVTANAIPTTNRTPTALTYGSSGQVINTQTNFGPGATPLQFMQPSPKDYQDFAFGLLPANADGQAFATPDTANGLRDSTEFLSTIGATFLDAAACNYYLCLHYALYSTQIPNTQG